MAKVFNYDEVPAVSTKAGKVKGYEFDGVHISKGSPMHRQAGSRCPGKWSHGKG